MSNLPQPPEGILDPQLPWSYIRPQSPLWNTLKARLTGRPTNGEHYSSYVNLTEADADRLIENLKKDPRGYPSLDQTSGTPVQWMERQRLYQEWLVEEYLENPFRQEVNEKIDAKTSDVLDRVFIEAKEEVGEAETKEEVVDILEDKKEILEDIQEKISPPPTENKIPDPWEDSYTTPKTEKKKKRERRRLKRPQGVIKKPKKKRKPSPPPGGNEPPRPSRRKKTFATKFGGGVRKTGKSLGKTLIDKLEGGGPLGENQGPSVLGAGIWIGKKITQAFRDAKKERARAVEAEKNGVEVPPEVKEKGYFIKKALGYQFGGKVLDQTVGAFFENIPSKQSSKKAGFSDKFDYGEGDPKNKKQQNDIKDLATGFRQVKTALKGINKSIDQQVGLLTQLIGETSRVADTLEAIQNSIGKQIDVEIQTDADQQQAQQSTGGGINIGDINLDMPGQGGGLDWFDMVMAADDVRDISKRIKEGGGQKTTNRKPRITGDVTPQRRRRFNFPLRRRNRGGIETQPVSAMIGEAGPELLIRNTPKKLAEGGVMQGAGSNIMAGLGATNDLMKRVQPFANVMEVGFQVVGAQISGALSSLVAAAGPFSGVIAKMFSPLLGGLATIFGLNQGAFAAEIDSAAMTEEQGAKTLSKFFASFFKIFGISFGEDDKKEDNNNNQTGPENFEGSVNAEKAFNFFKSKGLSAEQSAGIVGNLIQESGVDPNATNPKSGNTGIAQWDPVDRWGNFVNGKTYNGKEWKGVGQGGARQLENQLRYLYWEMDSGAGGMSLSTYKNAITLESATQTFLEKFERPGAWEAVLPKRIANAKGVISKYNKSASKGIVQPIANTFLNQVQGVFEMEGPDTGYKVPEYLTGGQPVIGHGLEWLIKMSNKFIILPGLNKEYNVYQNPAKAFTRYEQIGQQGGVEVAGLVDAMDRLIFGSKKTGQTPVYGAGAPKKFRGWAADESGAEILELLGGTRVKGASLPEGIVTPVAIPKDTVTGTTGAAVAMIAPVIKYVTVPVAGPIQVQYVPANPLVAAQKANELLYLQSV